MIGVAVGEKHPRKIVLRILKVLFVSLKVTLDEDERRSLVFIIIAVHKCVSDIAMIVR